MTKEQEKEVRRFLEMKGISSDCIDGAVKSIRFHETTKALRDDKDVKRGRDIIEFKPNPGKATLTQVGETQTYLGGDDRGLPIYQEDVDMIKKALPLAKRLIELQKIKTQEPVNGKPLSEMTAQEKMDYWDAKEENEKQTLRTLRDTIDEVYEIDPEELNMGPDTTENIHEISEEDRMNLEAGWYKLPDRVKEAMLKSQGDWQPGVKFPAGAVEKGLVDPGLEYYEATGRQPETPIEKYYVREHMKSLKPEEKEHYEKLFTGTENKKTFEPREQWEEKLANVAPEMVSREFWEEYYRKKTPEVDNEINDLMYPNKEAVDKAMEECNKNVSDPGDYYRYGNILKRMDDTHTRKNADYGDAAYKGYKKFGDYYFLVQLHNKLTRLENLTINNTKPQVEDESIDDTLLDMANYAVMYLESRHRND